MKLVAYGLAIVMGAVFADLAIGQDKEGEAPVAENESLRLELLERVKEDQSIRKELIKAGIDKPNQILVDKMKIIDEENTKWIREIVKRYGWPRTQLVGRDGASAAFLLVQHADSETQREMLPIVEKAYKDGEVLGQNFAMLLDRVLVGEGKQQVYGTQALPFDKWKNQTPELAPIEDEINVDKRRESVGLPPLSEYKKLLRDFYFPK